MRNRRTLEWLLAIAVLLDCGTALAQSAVTRGEDLYVDVSADGELVTNLLGDLWALPARGGVAKRLLSSQLPASRPSWSPDGGRLLFQSGPDAAGRIRVLDTQEGTAVDLAGQPEGSRHPTWHPDGSRIAISAPGPNATLDLWDIDVESGLSWRLTAGPHHDGEPAWSADGRDLAWVRRTALGWQLAMRPFGRPTRILVESEDALAAPAFRPDGTLVTYFRRVGDDWQLRMLILSEPPLDRLLVAESRLYPSRVSWRDRERFYYSTGEQLKTREFDAWSGRALSFRASPVATTTAPAFKVASRTLPATTPAEGRLVLRAGRLFDGRSRRYREATDVLVEDGIIADVTARRDWGDVPIIDLGSTTLIPGLIDVYARTPRGVVATDGAALLAWGVTTLVSAATPGFDPALWEGAETPGPRLLPARRLDAGETPEGESPPFLVVATNAGSGSDAEVAERVATWQAQGIPVLADRWTTALRSSTYLLPAAIRGSGPDATDPRRGSGKLPVNLAERQLVSGLADRRTPGVSALFDERQARTLSSVLPPGARVPLLADLRRSRTPVVLGSAPNRLPAGLALHAELLALENAGLPPDQALMAAGHHAAALLGLSGQLGEISVGARADLVFVNGDPLASVADARRIVAVVRNGRFHSQVALLDKPAGTVD